MLYFLGIIDILIEYEGFKQGEHVLKSVFYDSSTISVCPPAQYGPRFREFMYKVFSSSETYEDNVACNPAYGDVDSTSSNTATDA